MKPPNAWQFCVGASKRKAIWFGGDKDLAQGHWLVVSVSSLNLGPTATSLMSIKPEVVSRRNGATIYPVLG